MRENRTFGSVRGRRRNPILSTRLIHKHCKKTRHERNRGSTAGILRQSQGSHLWCMLVNNYSTVITCRLIKKARDAKLLEKMSYGELGVGECDIKFI